MKITILVMNFFFLKENNEKMKQFFEINSNYNKYKNKISLFNFCIKKILC